MATTDQTSMQLELLLRLLYYKVRRLIKQALKISHNHHLKLYVLNGFISCYSAHLKEAIKDIHLLFILMSWQDATQYNCYWFFTT